MDNQEISNVELGAPQSFSKVEANKKLISIGDLFKQSFGIYSKKFKTLFIIVSANIPIFLITLVYGSLFSLERVGLIALNILLFIVTGFIFFALVVIGSIVKLWSQFATMLSIEEDGQPVSVKQFFSTAWPRLDSFFWVYFLTGIIILGGLVLFIVPGIIFFVWYSVSIYVFVFEGIKGMGALKRSKELVRQYWWPVFYRFLLIGLMSFCMSLLTDWSVVIGAIVNIFFLMPFVTIYGYLLYRDLVRVKSVT